ncbi:hypothetical protein MMC25_007973 [Agyrium rufum]|nr:hypothetical protein [Agyrium rufum]
MSQPLKVLVSGAGIAGSCFAYWLARTNLNVSITIVERSPVPRVTGQCVDIRGPAIEVMKAMKLEEAIRGKITNEEGTNFLNRAGKPFATLKQGPGGHSFTAEYEILRADLSQLFLDATERIGNIKYIYGDMIKSIEQTDQTAHVTFSKGSEETYDLVVAADGGTSRTRSMILSEDILKDSYKPIGQYIAFFTIPTLAHDVNMWQWYNTPKGLSIMIRPHRDMVRMGAYLCITLPAKGLRDPVVEDALNKGVEGQKATLHEYFKDAGWEAKRVLEAMEQSDDFYMTRCAQVKLPKWTNNRALVIGDAAHATFGVGTSLAIEAAYLLAGEISKHVKTSADIPAAVASFEAVYRPIHDKSGDLPPGYPQLAFPQTSWGLKIRDTVLWAVTRMKLHKLMPDGDGLVQKLPEYEWVDR